jgi:hypothetical protein
MGALQGAPQSVLWASALVAPLFELLSCRRTGTVEDYQDRFPALLPRVARLDEAQRVQLFTRGLLPPLSLQVQQQNPPSLAATMSLAR